MRRSTKSCTPWSIVRTVPFILTTCGMTLCAVESVATVQTETTTCFSGSTLRLAMVCSATMIWAATTVVSMQSCGLAAWPPLPVTVISNWSAAAIIAPGRIAK